MTKRKSPISGENAVEEIEKKGNGATIIGAIYYLGGIVVVAYLSYLNPARSQVLFLDFVYYGIPLLMLAAGFRRHPRDGLAWLLIVLGWLVLFVNLSTCISNSSRVTNVANEYTQKAAAITEDYEKGLERIGWYAILDPVRLGRDSGLGESRQIIAGAREALDDYKRRGDEMSRALAKSVDDLDNPSLETTDFQIRLASTRKVASRIRGEILDLEAQIITEIETIIDLFESQSQAITFTESAILFNSQDAAAEYKSRLDNIDRLLLRQGRLAEEVANTRRTN